jgi:hypothetical protein
MNDFINVEGNVLFKQDNKIICECKNHLTGNLMKAMLSTMIASYCQEDRNGCYVYGGGTGYTISLGRGTQTPTGLISAPISPVIDMPLVSQSVFNGYSSSTDQYIDVIYIGIIEGSILSGAFNLVNDAVTEIALYFYSLINTTYRWSYYNVGALGSQYMMGYISAPLDFDSASIDITKSLTLEWRIRLSTV